MVSLNSKLGIEGDTILERKMASAKARMLGKNCLHWKDFGIVLFDAEEF